MATKDYDISEAGMMALSSANIYCIEDAVDKFIEEIMYWEAKLRDIDNGYAELLKMSLTAPVAMDYDMQLRTLTWSRKFAEETVSMLRRDLDLVRGPLDEVPFEE